MEAIITIFQPMNLLTIFIGMIGGFIVGALPGISPIVGITVLLPFTFGLSFESSLLMLIALYSSSMFAGAIPAILLRTPGTEAAAVTTFDGYPMSQKGETNRAINIAMFSSFFGGIIGTLVLIFLTPPLARVALKFGSSENFALMIMSLSVVVLLSRGNYIKGIQSALFGLFIASIGVDTISGTVRFTFGSETLLGGIEFVPALIGLFALSEVIGKSCLIDYVEDNVTSNSIRICKKNNIDFKDLYLLRYTILRSSIIGTIIGILPGTGATIASFLSYNEAIRFSKDKDSFGKGNPHGIACCESANNSAASGALVPMLALGIPGSGATAVIMGAFIIHGLQPGPLLFQHQAEAVSMIMYGLLFAQIPMLVMTLYAARYLSRISEISYKYLGPVIILLTIIGSFAIRNSLFDVLVMFIFGLLGVFMDKYNYPTSPMVLGIILGPLVETSLRRAILSAGLIGMLSKPIVLILLIITVVSVVGTIFLSKEKKSVNNA